MSTNAIKLLEDAMTLSDADRADLAACLFASLDETTFPTADPAWEAEIKRRLDAIDSGQATLIPWEVARRRIFADA
jgi:putative addiction module component (TIGR02574 family)